jgi:hypothetical protein
MLVITALVLSLGAQEGYAASRGASLADRQPLIMHDRALPRRVAVSDAGECGSQERPAVPRVACRGLGTCHDYRRGSSGWRVARADGCIASCCRVFARLRSECRSSWAIGVGLRRAGQRLQRVPVILHTVINWARGFAPHATFAPRTRDATYLNAA